MITCNFENGGNSSLRHVTVGTIVVKNNKILLGKRGTFKGKPILESGKWGLLGGFMNRDEDLMQAVKREVLEESGWEIEDITLLCVNHRPDRPKEDRQNVEFVFIAHAVKQVSSSDEEVTHLQWFDLDHLPQKEEVAFDHYQDLDLYLQYVRGTIKIPVLG